MSGVKVSVFAFYTGRRHLQRRVLLDSVGMKNGIHGADSSGGSHGARPAFPNRLPAPLSLSLAGIDPFPNGNMSTNINNNKGVFQPSWRPDIGKAPGSGPRPSLRGSRYPWNKACARVPGHLLIMRGPAAGLTASYRTSLSSPTKRSVMCLTSLLCN